MKLLIYHWNDYLHYDLCDVCRHFHISYEVLRWEFKDKNHDDAFLKWFSENISAHDYAALISINYFPLLAQVAKEGGIKYIAYCYDNPLNVINMEDTLGYETNYVFLYDRKQYQKYKQAGFDTVWHMPLGVNSRRLSTLQPTPMEHQKYDTAISFVGNLYNSKLYEILSLLGDYHKGYLNAIMEAQSKIYGYYMIDELLTEDILQAMQCEIDARLSDKTFYLRKEALSFALASEITKRERLLLINLLGKRFPFKFYSYDQNPLIQNVTQMGAIDYVTQMPQVFFCSKINLNPTLKIIQSGIPLRAFDIMGAGGFLLSNWQEELNELYVDGEELVMYTSIEDAIAKCDFYLKHEDLRQKIAAAGRAKTLDSHNLDSNFQTMLSTAGL